MPTTVLSRGRRCSTYLDAVTAPMAEQPSITVAELARRLGGRLDGAGGRVVWGVGALDQAGPEAVSWLGSARYLPQLADTEAGVVLVPEDCEVPAHALTRKPLSEYLVVNRGDDGE